MKGHLFWRQRGRPENGAWYGKWLVGRTQVLRRLGRNKAKSREALGKIVSYINRQVRIQKREHLMKMIDQLLKEQSQ